MRTCLFPVDYAMIMAFKDETRSRSAERALVSTVVLDRKGSFAREELDINQRVAKYSNPDPEVSKLKKGLKDIRLTSCQARNQIELPEAAELVFPDLGRVAEEALEGNGRGKEPGTRGKLKNAGAWVQDYLDRRSQAFYVSEILDAIMCGLRISKSKLTICCKPNTRGPPWLHPRQTGN